MGLKNIYDKMKSKKSLSDIEQRELDERDNRLSRCKPVALEILKIIANNNPYLGELQDKSGQPLQEASDKYNEIGLLILTEMENADLYYSEKLYVFGLLEQAMSLSKEKVQLSLERSLERAESFLWGKDVLDLKMSDIDRVLKEKEGFKEKND